MTTDKNLKRRIRERQAQTGESYSAARLHVLGERIEVATPATKPTRHEAVVLKVNKDSARVRILGEEAQLTFRSGDVDGVTPIVPGHLVTLDVEKRWAWRGEDYASGRLGEARIDIPKLGLLPLPLEGGDLENVRDYSEPYTEEEDGPYAKLWKRNTAKARPSYEFDGIAWGQLPEMEDPEDNLTCEASELMAVGRREEARGLLMDTLALDLRVLDAHAHLGNMVFDRSPDRAIVHYEIGLRIGELSLAAKDVLLVWGRIYNRPFLRCLHGYGLCLWRAGDFVGAKAVFERLLKFNPTDNQGVRFCWADVAAGRKWKDENERDEPLVESPRRRGGTTKARAKRRPAPKTSSGLSAERVAEMIEVATADARGALELTCGWLAMFETFVVLPFETKLLGVGVTVTAIGLRDDRIIAICMRGKESLALDIVDLPMPSPPPYGAEWIHAYRHWLEARRGA